MSKKLNVYLCDMASGSNMNLLPLAIGMVGSYAEQFPEIREHFNIEYRYLRQSGETLADTMEDPVLIGFSCYVWNLRGSMAAASVLKRRFPKALIVVGGYSIPKINVRIKEYFNKYPFVDMLVHGEGEVIFLNILRELISDKNFSTIQGLTFQSKDVSDGFLSDPRAVRVKSLDEIPSPFLNGMFDQIMKLYGPSVTGALWETNRGCPYSCTFCDWGGSDLNKVNKYSLPRLYDEIQWIGKKGFYYMFFSDANFGIFAERDLEIAGYIADSHARYRSPHHVVTNWAKNKGENVVAIAERLALGGVASNITMAIQSTHEPTLKAIKRKNLEQGKIGKLKGLFNDRHIPTYVEVILGLPLETYETFSKGLNQILSNRLDDRFFVYLCQMLENTELASPESREEYQLITRHCRHTVSNRKFEWKDEHTEYEEFVIGTSTMPIQDWRRAYVLGYFLTVLYNHRAAVFFFMYLREEFQIPPVDFLEFVIQNIRGEIGPGTSHFSALSTSIKHIERQADLMIEGVSSMTDLPEADGLVVLPHVGGAVLISKHSDAFYEEMKYLLRAFAEKRNIELDPLILEELVLYQKIRYPSWPKRTLGTYEFKTNLPEYFQHLTRGWERIPIQRRATQVLIEDHRRSDQTFPDFAATLVRGGLTVDLLLATLPDVPLDERDRTFLELRRQMEQRNLDKLSHEFQKVKGSDGERPSLQ